MESPDREVPLCLNTEVPLYLIPSMESPDREVPLYLNTEVSLVCCSTVVSYCSGAALQELLSKGHKLGPVISSSSSFLYFMVCIERYFSLSFV